MIPLQVIGLLLDVIGAFVIAWPDIPRVNRFLMSARLRAAKTRLETGVPFTHAMTGYSDLLDVIVEINEEVGGEIELSNVSDGRPPLQLSNQQSHIYQFRRKEGDESELVPEQLDHVGYDIIRVSLNEKIRAKEARVRGGGFLLLASGFILQIAGIVAL